jgi:hypothetical protein
MDLKAGRRLEVPLAADERMQLAEPSGLEASHEHPG